ncbi:TilS substrate C-terminal domain-containing protein [Piscinibacter sakaiensis]|uniref:TilS substrate C-terminal domain-containing protein n=1 Tax=Piscinibacter sakaiensis TaxID=1547922 RepID=UPI00372BD62F
MAGARGRVPAGRGQPGGRGSPRRPGPRGTGRPGRPPRALKKQYQAAGVAAAARHGPLLWAGADLLFVPGLGLDARALAAPGEPQVALDWLPDEAAG